MISRYLPLVPALSLIALAPGAMNGACVDGEPPLLAAAALATDASCMCQTTATPQRAIKSKGAIQQALLSRSSTR
jgi:hypothetical protein